MMPAQTCDCALAGLEALPRLAADEGRAARVRGRCHMRLLRSRRRGGRLRVVMGSLRLLAPALVSGVCAVYLLLLVALTIRLAEWGG